MKNFYLIFMLVCFMGGMVLSAKAEEKEPLIIEMLNKRDKEKMLYGQDVVKIDVGQTIVYTKFSATEVQHDGEEYFVVAERDIVAVVED